MYDLQVMCVGVNAVCLHLDACLHMCALYVSVRDYRMNRLLSSKR